MPAFDAELYLRLLGERELLGGGDHYHPHHGSPLQQAADALVAVDRIDADAAASITDDYARAGALRGVHGLRRFGRWGIPGSVAAPATPALGPRRTVPVQQRIETFSGELSLEYVSLSPHGVSLGARVRWAPGAMQALHRQGHTGMDELTLADDRGTTTEAHFNGGGGDDEWRGHYQGEEPLAVDTAWIEVEGTRIDLPEVENRVEVWIEDLPPRPPAWRHLWHAVAAADHFGGRDIQPALNALRAAGAIDADDPQLEQLQAVAGQHPRAPAGMRGHRGGGTGLPEPWVSVGRFAGTGRQGTIVVGAATPVFDGVSVAVNALEADSESFEASVEIAPGVLGRPSSSERIAWWAADDRGNHHHGTMGSWSGGGDHDEGTVEFSGGIDPRARWIDVMPTTPTKRAVIRVPLGDGEAT